MPESYQPDLPLAAAPDIASDELRALLALLVGRGWVLARQICDEMPGWSDRKIRALANASEGQVISGQLGYILVIEATLEEVNRFANAMRHQASEMDRRAGQALRVAHARIGR